MTGRIRSSRIGGRRTEPRRCAPGRAMAAVLAASFAVLAIGGAGSLAPIGAAIAQTPGTAGPVTINDLFTGDSPVLNGDAAQKLADAARKAQAPGECPLGRLTINMPEGDPLFQQGLGAARRDAVLAFLDRQGIKASRFLVDIPVGGTQSNVRLDYNVSRDDVAPELDVQWTPTKGSKVKARDRITAKAIARDDANLWQTGIKTIDLDVQGGGQFGFEDYPQPPQTCESPPPPRTLEGVYTVPANPPPIVRLRARTKDYAGHPAQDTAEFPTGDWTGTIDWSIPHRNGRHWGRLDLALDYDGKGNLTGRMAGDEHQEAKWESCQQTTQTPAKLSAKLVGQYTPGRNTMSLQIAEPQFEKGQLSLSGCGPGYSGAFGGGGPLHQPGLVELLNSLAVTTDGGFEARGRWAVIPASTQSTLHMTLKLNRTRN